MDKWDIIGTAIIVLFGVLMGYGAYLLCVHANEEQSIAYLSGYQMCKDNPSYGSSCVKCGDDCSKINGTILRYIPGTSEIADTCTCLKGTDAKKIW